MLNSPPIAENTPGLENGTASQRPSRRMWPVAMPPGAATDVSNPLEVMPSGPSRCRPTNSRYGSSPAASATPPWAV